jgi:hypothetical protein
VTLIAWSICFYQEKKSKSQLYNSIDRAFWTYTSLARLRKLNMLHNFHHLLSALACWYRRSHLAYISWKLAWIANLGDVKVICRSVDSCQGRVRRVTKQSKRDTVSPIEETHQPRRISWAPLSSYEDFDTLWRRRGWWIWRLTIEEVHIDTIKTWPNNRSS